MADISLEEMARALEASDDYRVLRRLTASICDLSDPVGETKLGIMLDIETTGLDTVKDEIIALGMVPFWFTSDGTITKVAQPFVGMRDPGRPIPPEITRITGISDTMVAGREIDANEVDSIVSPASLVVAFHANFDRPFCNRRWAIFRKKAWACACDEIDWDAEGFEGRKLSYLLMRIGLFYDAHRAVADCQAALELLIRPLPVSGVTGLAKLLESARRAQSRIWATGSPFEKKDALKERGYRWNTGDDGRPKSWYVDVEETAAAAELDWLQREVYRRSIALRIERITAFNRFS